jgi:uncharacterized protein (DUF342 family)
MENEKLNKHREYKADGLYLELLIDQAKLKLFVEAKWEELQAKELPNEELPEIEPGAEEAKKITFNDEDFLKLLSDVPADLRNEDVINEVLSLLRERKEVKRRRVAKGKEAKPGRDGKLLMLVKDYKSLKSGESPEFVDPRFIKTFDNIEVNTPIARVYPPVAGEDGMEVTGKAIKAQSGKEIKVQTNQETISRNPPTGNDRFEILISLKAGYLTVERGALTIQDQLVISGDVGFKSGDVDFIGKVRVQGSVQTNFNVVARDDIEIVENLQNGTVRSKRGSVKIKGAAIGSPIAVIGTHDSGATEAARLVSHTSRVDISAFGAFSAQICQGVSVESFGDIYIEKEASNSYLHTRAMLFMPKGALVGGEVFAVCGVEARSIGSRLGSETKIHLVSDIESSMEYVDLMYRIEKHQSAVDIIKLHLGPYAENRARLAVLNRSYREKLEKLIKQLDLLNRSLHQLEQERTKLLVDAKFNPTLRVNFHERLYKGVVITAGEQIYVCQDELRGPGTIEYLPTPKKFIVREYLPLECSIGKQNDQATIK